MSGLTRGWLWLALCLPVVVSAQIDPVRRDLIQIGCNQAVEPALEPTIA